MNRVYFIIRFQTFYSLINFSLIVKEATLNIQMTLKTLPRTNQY